MSEEELPIPFSESYDDDWLVMALIPGILIIRSDMQFGNPTIVGYRLSANNVDLSRALYEERNQPESKQLWPGPSNEQRLAAYAFALGMEWQKSRKLRKRMQEAVQEGWRKLNKKSGIL